MKITGQWYKINVEVIGLPLPYMFIDELPKFINFYI